MALSILKRKDLDMTQGTIWKLLLQFALPLMIGNVFQQLYTTVDSIVVGNFVGSEALAAIGSTGCLINAIIGFFSGLASGAGIVISQYFGAKDDKNLHDAVQTSIAMTLVLSVFVTALGIALAPIMLRWANTPDDVMEQATIYLQIYFAGASGLMLYNMGSGILRAVGDSQRPLYFLIFSTFTNIVLDLLFVLAFDLGIAGVAYATILSQFISAALTLVILTRAKANYRMDWRNWHFSMALLRRILNVGMPTGIQMAITSISNVFVQAYINNFGSACMAGWSSYGKIDQVIMLPMSSIGIASSTFVGQNVGARNWERMKKGVHVALGLCAAMTAALIAFTMIFARPLVSLFNQEPDVIYYGTLFIWILSPFYILCLANQIYNGALRGAGNSRVPMIITLSSFVVFRQIYLYVSTALSGNILWVALGYPAGWILCSILSTLYYYFGNWEKKCREKLSRR